MIETRKLKLISNVEEIIQTIDELAKEMQVKAEMTIAVFRMGNRHVLPIVRSDFQQSDLLSLLLGIVGQEQSGELSMIDWQIIMDQLWSKMNDDQRDRLMGKKNLFSLN